jgi:haloacetate dehalogenase
VRGFLKSVGAECNLEFRKTRYSVNDEHSTRDIDRRELFRRVAAVAAATSIGRLENVSAQQDSSGTSRFFPGFVRSTVQTSGTTITAVKGGEGPPLLLLHGAPQSYLSWRLVAPQLAKEYTVIATDLRGYGDSGKLPDTADHSNYSKRNMALDQVEVMRHFGFNTFPVVGHDRGGRVAHRMALDHPDKVTKLAVLDILPTYYLYTHVTLAFVQAYFHWFNYLRPAPGPENDLKAQYEAQKARATSEIQLEYLRTSGDPANIHAMCEDYRAAASIDLKHDEADVSKKIAAPLLTLWGEKGSMGRLYDVLAVWRERGTTVTGKGLPGGHNLQEDVPDQVVAELRAFLRA